MKKKALISSILTIALCLSLIAGSTFALFTSESAVNVAVTSGNVNVIATIENEDWGSELGAMLPETEINFDKTGNTVTMDKIVPGDWVSFDLRIKNLSDISVNTRTLIQKVADTGLWNGLVVTIDGEIYNGATKKTDWTLIEPGSADVIVSVKVALPVDAGNDYQGKSCKLSYTVEAVQGNAKPESADTESFADVLAKSNYVTLTEDVVLSDEVLTIAKGRNVVIDLGGNTLSGSSTASTTSKLLEVAPGATLTLKNGTISFYATTPDTNWGGEGQPPFPGYANNTIVCRGNLIIDGATVENTTAKGGASYAIDCYAGANLVVNSGLIDGCGKIAIRMFTTSATIPTNVTINGGKVIGSRAVWVQLAGSDSSVAPLANLTVNGGTLVSTGEGSGADFYQMAIYSYSYGNSFGSTVATRSAEGGFLGTTIALNGGTFIGDVALGGGSEVGAHNLIIRAEKCDFYGNVYSYNTNDVIPTVENKAGDSAPVAEQKALISNLEAGNDVLLLDDVKIQPAGLSSGYGTTGINVKNGQTVDGNGNVLDIKGAGGTWDSGINTTGGTIKNITITGSFRGIFVNHNSDHSERVILENVIIDGTTYTISCDQANGQGLTAINSTFNGWTSYAATLGDAKFVDCYFGEGNGYSYMRPYAATVYEGCTFEEGYTIDPRAAVELNNCYYGDTLITAENVASLGLFRSLDNVTIH